MAHVSGGIDPVSVHVSESLMVVSCVPGWTEAQWDKALQPHSHHRAYLVGMDDGDDADGFEIYMFQIEQEEAA